MRTVDWADALVHDATALRDTMRDSHPGCADVLNPGFGAALDANFAQAISRADAVETYGGYWWAMRAFAAAFDDAHVTVSPTPVAPAVALEWPGFLTGFDGGAQVVRVRVDDPSLPPLGAELVEGNGLDAAALAERHVGEFSGIWSLPATRERLGGWLFVDRGNPFIERVESCRFRVDGELVTFEPRWRAIDAADLRQRLVETHRIVARPNGWHRFGAGHCWIGLGSFDGDPRSSNHAELGRLLNELEANAAVLRAAPRIVLDLRGNGGGSSHWSEWIAALLWDAAAVRAWTARAGHVQWRASRANLDQITGLAAALRAEPASGPEVLRWTQRVEQGLATALSEGKALWDEPADGPALATETRTAEHTPSPGKVYVLTDAACGSAALDAVDLWKAMGAVQIGRETSADTLYMDIRMQALPSSMSRVSVPMKVWRGRPRASNEAHTPTHRYPGDMRDTPALEAWVQRLPG